MGNRRLGSDCINKSLLGSWSYSWITQNNAQIEKIIHEYRINDETVPALRKWVDKAFDEHRVGWINLFREVTDARDYKHQFFTQLPDVFIAAIYFSASESEALQQEFKPSDIGTGAIGLCDTLNQGIAENELSTEMFIGFDIIGVEMDGSFHSFYCHDISAELVERFDLQINEYGLFEDSKNWQPVLDYMNDEQNGFEPVHWFICKVKLVPG